MPFWVFFDTLNMVQSIFKVWCQHQSAGKIHGTIFYTSTISKVSLKCASLSHGIWQMICSFLSLHHQLFSSYGNSKQLVWQYVVQIKFNIQEFYINNHGYKNCFLLYFAGVLTLTSSIIPTVLTYIHGWAPSPGTIGTIIDPRDPDYLEYMEYEYAKPWNRFSPYGIGILLGYLLHTTKGKHVKISKARHILSTNINCQKHISFSTQCFSYWTYGFGL